MTAGGIEYQGLIGGLTILDKPVTSLPQDLASALTSLNAGLLGATYVPLRYIGTQVVNGVNHYLLAKDIRATKDKDTSIVIMVINIPPGSVGGKGATLVKIIEEETDVPAAIRAIFEKATRQLIGVDYKMLLFIGSQVVKGINYHFICQAKVVYPGAEPKVVRLVINEFQNEISVVSITPIGENDPLLG
jgi:hypothetical protein